MTLYSAILLGIHQMLSEWYYDDSHYRRAVVLHGLRCLSDFTQLLKRETLIYFYVDSFVVFQKTTPVNKTCSVDELPSQRL